PAFHAALARDYRLAHHARLRRWDGLRAATPGDIVLDDGVVIELGGEDLIPGDFWVFATRTADRSVERLIEAPPHGIRHRHYRLATIHRCTSGGDESVAIDDLRPTFDPLPRLRAADVAYDPGCWLPRAPEWADVTNVQEALDAICRLDLDADVKTHNRFLHGHGVVCGLKVKCNPVDRGQVVVDRGYALDCDGSGIQVRTLQLVDLVERARDLGLLDDDGNGEVCLTLGRGAAADATIGLEAHRTSSRASGTASSRARSSWTSTRSASRACSCGSQPSSCRSPRRRFPCPRATSASSACSTSSTTG
ncbi:MAG: hypothetical protein GWO04_07860, partial [Actinobacteria bacterium]|nr:hypothetical protein [Actinomycetota bacterium]NIW26977.1 hypothetical protein [Actinomycetota bacterium]